MPFDKWSHDAAHETWVGRVHAVLQQVFQRSGRGSVQRVEKALGISQGSFRQWRRRGHLDLDVLFRALGVLDVSPARFWVEVFGGDFDPVAVAKRPTGPPRDPVVRRAVARWQSSTPDHTKKMTEELWQQLDELRGEDPKLAVRRIKAALKNAERSWIPRLLAAYGSARRAEAQLKQALEALHYTLLLAEDANERHVCADILQRLGVAYAYTGNHALGLLFAKEAANKHRLAGNVRGEARSWVDQGQRLFHLGRLEDAIAAHKAALRCLPRDDTRYRFSAYHSVAVAYLRQGRSSEAAESIKKAEKLAPLVGEELAVMLNATKAKLAITQGDYSQAESSIVAVIATYRTRSPLDAALASVDLVRIQFLMGRMNTALETINRMAAFLQPLKDNAIASEAITQLIRLALTGSRITRRILDEISRRLEEGRAR